MATLHKAIEDGDLHPPGIISADDPASTFGTEEATGGTHPGLMWIEHTSGDADALEAIKFRNAANDGWVDLFALLGGGDGLDNPASAAEGALVYASAADTLAALAIGTTGQVLTVSAGGIPEWAAPAASGYTQGDVILAAGGTSGAAGYGFDGDPNTGMYSDAADRLKFTVGGGTAIDMAPTAIDFFDPIRQGDGSAGTPVYSFRDDTNTGLYRPGADQLGVALAGTEHVRFQVNATYWGDNSDAFSDHRFESNRTVSDVELAILRAYWNGTSVGAIRFRTGADTTNKDDGYLQFLTAEAGTLVEAMTLTQSGGLVLPNIPTSDPSVTNEIWSDGGVLVFSGSTAGGGGGGYSEGDTILAGVGTLAAPGLSFTGRTNTGLYSSAVGLIELVANGTLVAQATNFALLMSEDFRAVDGSSTRPGIAFKDDNDTGFRRTGSGQISVLSNATELFRFAPNEVSIEAGVGFSVPTGEKISFDGDTVFGNTWVREDSADRLLFRIGGTDTLVLDSGGVEMPNLPTSDPLVSGELWNDAGTVKISA